MVLGWGFRAVFEVTRGFTVPRIENVLQTVLARIVTRQRTGQQEPLRSAQLCIILLLWCYWIPFLIHGRCIESCFWGVGQYYNNLHCGILRHVITKRFAVCFNSLAKLTLVSTRSSCGKNNIVVADMTPITLSPSIEFSLLFPSSFSVNAAGSAGVPLAESLKLKASAAINHIKSIYLYNLYRPKWASAAALR